MAAARRALAVSRKRKGSEGTITTLLGSEATQATAHATVTAKPEAYQFVAAATGRIEELTLETNGTANTGVTSVWLGVFGQAAGGATGAAPANYIQFGQAIGTAPGINEKITVKGLSVPVISGMTYHLVVLSFGAPVHFNIKGAGGTNNWRLGGYEVGSMYNLNNSWGAAKAEGPAKFYAIGKTIGSARSLIMGVQNGQNHPAFWPAKSCYVSRGYIAADPTEVGGETTPLEVSEAVATSLSLGFHYPIVLLNVQKLLSEVNTTLYAEKCAAIIKKVREDHPTVTLFEILNEPQSKGPHEKSNAADYAAICKAVIEKCRLEGITGAELLITASGDYTKVNAKGEAGESSAVFTEHGWVHDMLEAQPTLKAGGTNEIKAWVSHHYGRASEITNEVQGGILAAAALRQTVVFNGGGGYNNWYITEFGFNQTGTGSGHFAATEVEQNTLVKEYAEAAILIAEAGWLKLLNVYDDGTDESWNVYGKTAGATFGSLALEHAKS